MGRPDFADTSLVIERLHLPLASSSTCVAQFRPAKVDAFYRRFNHREHLRSLDGVRGLAVLMVLCHHLCPWAARSPLGVLCATLWLGVDLFFVLSGFLITGLLYDTLQQPNYFRTFFARRVLRLLPVYVVVVSLVLVANAVLGGRATVLAAPYFLYGSNIIRDLLIHHRSLSIGVVQHLDVSHLWSLAVEEQFYLVWPLLVWWARSYRRILILCFTGTAASVAIRFIVAGQPHFWLGTPYFELPMRLDSLLLGGVLALLMRSPRANLILTPFRLYTALFAGLLGLAMSFAAAGHGTMFSAPLVRYGYLAAAVAFSALIGLAVQPGTWVCRLGETSLLRSLGRCSYCLYLIHLVPVFWYRELLELTQRSGWTGWQREGLGTIVFLAYSALCFGLATLSYNTLESFFLRGKKLFRYEEEAGSELDASAGLEVAGSGFRATQLMFAEQSARHFRKG